MKGADKGKSGAERRRHRRSEVATIILVAPNGNENRSVVYDMSRSGARISIPRDLDFGIGAGVRLYFPRVHGSTIMLGAKIVRGLSPAPASGHTFPASKGRTPMALKTAKQGTGAERRRHTRLEVATAVMVSPNGHANHTTIFDISESGARIALPPDFEHGEGALMRLHFPKAHGPMVLFAEIKRVAMDHVGVEFVENQEPLVNQLLDELSED